MMKRIQIITFLLLNVMSFSQSQFQLAIGDSTHSEEARSIIQTTDGGYIAVGESDWFGEMYIVKLNSSGQLQWSRTIAGTGRGVALSVVQTTDGGYAVAGYRDYFGPYFAKLTPAGAVEWIRVLSVGFSDPAWSIVQTTDRGYAAAISPSFGGFSPNRMTIVKLDSMGMLQWSKNIQGHSYARSIRQTTDKGYVVAGATESFGAGDFDMFIVKLDSNGSLQWAKTIGGTNTDIAYSIVQTTNGGYAVAGETYSFGNLRMYVVKLNSSGMLQWTKVVGAGLYVAYSIIQTTDGGYAVAGDIGGGGGIPIVKFDPDGTLQWSRRVGGTGTDGAYSIIQTTDGGYVAAGYSNSFGPSFAMFIVKLDNNGNTCGNFMSPSISVETGGIFGSPTPTVTNITLSVTAPAVTTGSQGYVTPICVIGIQPVSNEIPASFKLYQNYPNPFNPETKIRFDIPPSKGARGMTVSLKIYDITGKEVLSMTEEKLAGSYSVTFDGTNFASGVYIYKIESGDLVDMKKMVLLK